MRECDCVFVHAFMHVRDVMACVEMQRGARVCARMSVIRLYW
jgi:hypothetical protein